MTDAIPSRAATVYRGFFHLRWLAEDESVRSAGDGTGAIVVESSRGSRRVELGEHIHAKPNPNCPECGGTGVVEVQSSGDHHTGFDREWDDCDCKYLADRLGRSEDTA